MTRMQGVAHLAIVDTDNTSDHLGYNDHVAKMSFDYCGLLIRGCLLLCFTQLLDETHGAALETSSKPATCTGVYQLCRRVSYGRQ